MNFVNPLFLFALGAVAVPVLIHLLTRDRIQHAAFSTLRFFAKGAKLVVRRKKFEEMLLLLMRIALAALLAFAFARPFFGTKAPDTRREYGTARVVVLDVSGSMRRAGLADAMKKEADDALGSLTDGQDEAALITFSDTPTVAEPISEKVSSVKTAADATTPGYGGTNIADALRKANELLRPVRAKQKEIVLVSDLQRGGWNYFKGDWKLASDVKLTVQQVKPSDAGSGLAIVEMSAPSDLVLDKQPSSVAVRIENYSDQERDKVDVSLWLAGNKIDTQQVNLRAGGKVAVRFRHVFDTPGDNPGSIVVGDDASTPANTVYFNARVIPRIPVLLIDGKPSATPQDDGAFFIAKALVPSDASPFVVKTLAANQVSAADVNAATVAILANVGEVPAPVDEALNALLDRGGGVFYLPGDEVKADTFNAQFGSIAPCKLRQILQAHPTNGDSAESLTRIDFDHPIFDVFSLPHHGDLGLPKFAHYWETTDTQLSRVLARFGDGRPAILERGVGKGVSIALVSGIESDWNDFAYQSVFLPYIHQTVRYLAVQTGQQTVYNCGDQLPVPDGDTLKDPQNNAVTSAKTGTAKVIFYATQPGFYTAFNVQGQPDITFAVNGSMSESDPATIAGDEIAAAIERAPDEQLGSLETDTSAPATSGQQDAGLWWYLIWAVLLLTFGELVLGNKTLRH
jgi:hypothetical protein